MRVMLLAFVSIGVIAFASEQVLMRAGWSSAERTATGSVRLDCAPPTLSQMFSGQTAMVGEDCER